MNKKKIFFLCVMQIFNNFCITESVTILANQTGSKKVVFFGDLHLSREEVSPELFSEGDAFFQDLFACMDKNPISAFCLEASHGSGASPQVKANAERFFGKAIGGAMMRLCCAEESPYTFPTIPLVQSDDIDADKQFLDSRFLKTTPPEVVGAWRRKMSQQFDDIAVCPEMAPYQRTLKPFNEASLAPVVATLSQPELNNTFWSFRQEATTLKEIEQSDRSVVVVWNGQFHLDRLSAFMTQFADKRWRLLFSVKSQDPKAWSRQVLSVVNGDPDCNVCFKTASLAGVKKIKICPCSMKRYCGKVCQAENWKEHKKEHLQKMAESKSEPLAAE